MNLSGLVKSHANTVALSLVAVSLPFPRAYSLFTIWLLVVWWLIRVLILRDVRLERSKLLPILLFGSPLFLLTISLSYSSRPDLGFGLIERSASLLAFPILIGALGPSDKEKQNVLGSFTVCLIMVSLACLGVGMSNLLSSDSLPPSMNSNNFDYVDTKWNYVSYIQLLSPLGLHPTFYTLFASVALLHLFLLLSRTVTIWKRVLYSLAIAFLMLMVVLAGARMGILSLLVATFVFLLLHARKLGTLFVVGLLAVVVLLGTMIEMNPFLKKRFDIVDSLAFPADISGWNAINMRLAIWQCSWGEIKANPVLGVGSGDNKALGNACHAQYSFYNVFGQNLNCHNQYMEYQLIGGLPLTLSFLGGLGTALWAGRTRKDRVYVMFLLIFALNCLAASLLSVFHGITFYSFFNALFYFGANES